MKKVNAENTIIGEIKTWYMILLIFILSTMVISCNGDDNDVNDDVAVAPQPDEPEELASAWAIGYVVATPQGGVWYLNVSEEIPESLNISNSIELGFNKRVSVFGDNPYVYDPDARTFTKWEVNRTDLSASPEAILSLAATGFNPVGNAYPVYVSETQAFSADLAEGLMIEWNPEDMTITEIFQVEPLVASQENRNIRTDFPYFKNDKAILPIVEQEPSTCCDFNTTDIGAIVAVFDVNTKTLEYQKDDRLLATRGTFASDENGTFYFGPDDGNSVIVEYFDINPQDFPSPHTILRLNDDGTIDPNFQLDVDEILEVEVFSQTITILDNKAVINYIDSNDGQFPESFDNNREIFQTPARTVAIDLTTREVTEFSALEKYDFVAELVTIDSKNYFLAFSSEENPFDTSHYLLQNSVDDYTELGAYNGIAVQLMGMLWEN
ncbi:MAG: hypothetical protein AAGF77_01545 [Bacteroidota bacterium]